MRRAKVIVAPNTIISSTNITMPMGPLDFLIGGAALATLFLGIGAFDAGLRGGPFDAGPPGGVDFFGANGD